MSTSFWLRVGAIWGFLRQWRSGAFQRTVSATGLELLGDHLVSTTERPEGIFQTATHYHAYYVPSRLWPWACSLRPDAGEPRFRSPAGRHCCWVP